MLVHVDEISLKTIIDTEIGISNVEMGVEEDGSIRM